MSSSRRTRARSRSVYAALALSCSFPLPALAIGTNPGQAAPVVENGRIYVGKIQNPEMASTGTMSHVGTGSVISERIVLSAAHVFQPEVLPHDLQLFDRFYVDGSQRFGLGVTHPDFKPDMVFRDNNRDAGIFLTLNGIILNKYGTIPAAAPAVNAGDVLHLVGFSNGEQTAVPGPLRGTMKVRAAPNGVQANEYVYTVADHANFIEPGDSGGPTFRNATNDDSIVAVHSWGTPLVNPVTQYDVRTDPHRNFILGQGVGVAQTRRVDSLIPSNPPWNDSWNQVAWNGRVPVADDVAVLDPTTDNDNANIVKIQGFSTPDLQGVLNDVTLQLSGNQQNPGILSITGGAGMATAGKIILDPFGGLFIDYALDSRAEIQVNGGGLLKAGIKASGAGGSNFVDSFRNEGILRVGAGGRVEIFGVVGNSGNITDLPALTTNIGSILVEGDATSQAFAIFDGTFNRGLTRVRFGFHNSRGLFDNTGSFDAQGNVSVSVTLLRNRVLSPYLVQGNNDGTAIFNATVIENFGTLTIGDKTFAQVERSLGNDTDGRVLIGGGPVGSLANLKNIANRGIFTFGQGNQSTAQRLAAEPGPALRNFGLGNMFVDSGARLRVEGALHNEARLHLVGSNNVLLTPGQIVVDSTNAQETPEFVNDSFAVVQFDTPGGGDGGMAQIKFADLRNFGSLKGKGTFQMVGSASVRNGATANIAPELDMRALDFDMVSTPGVAGDPAVTFEVTNKDVGEALAGFASPFSIGQLCVRGISSEVKLIDFFRNEDVIQNTEALYVTTLGLTAGNKIDLNGLKLYYRFVDPACGLNGQFVNGTPILVVPEPACAVILLASGLLSRRPRVRREHTRYL